MESMRSNPILLILNKRKRYAKQESVRCSWSWYSLYSVPFQLFQPGRGEFHNRDLRTILSGRWGKRSTGSNNNRVRDEDYMWYLSSWSDERPFKVGNSGKVTGLAIGKGQIAVMGLESQVSTIFNFYTNSGKEVTLFLDMHSVHTNGNNLEVEIDCEVKGQPAEGTELLAAFQLEDTDTLYFLPKLTPDVQAFSLNPKVGTHELIQFPVHQVPYNITFYAATLNNDKYTSNIASKVFMGKEINK